MGPFSGTWGLAPGPADGGSHDGPWRLTPGSASEGSLTTEQRLLEQANLSRVLILINAALFAPLLFSGDRLLRGLPARPGIDDGALNVVLDQAFTALFRQLSDVNRESC